MSVLRSYKMTSDSGFAPNPFHRYITLANCKPGIRKLDNIINQWIAGFTSGELCGHNPGQEKLVFIMKVQEQLTYFQYWNDKRFQKKKPNNGNNIGRAGDNIYMPKTDKKLSFDDKDFFHIDNCNHPKKSHKKEDISGGYVLISDDFYYFGKKAKHINFLNEINLPTGMSQHGVITDYVIEKLLNYLSGNHPEKGLLGEPHSWCKEENNNRTKNC